MRLVLLAWMLGTVFLYRFLQEGGPEIQHLARKLGVGEMIERTRSTAREFFSGDVVRVRAKGAGG